MALAKVKNRETILKGIIGLLIATNILSFGQYIVKCNELSDERIAHKQTIEKEKKDLKAKLKMYYNLPIDINQMQQLIDIKKEEYQILLKTKH